MPRLPLRRRVLRSVLAGASAASPAPPHARGPQWSRRGSGRLRAAWRLKRRRLSVRHVGVGRRRLDPPQRCRPHPPPARHGLRQPARRDGALRRTALQRRIRERHVGVGRRDLVDARGAGTRPPQGTRHGLRRRPWCDGHVRRHPQRRISERHLGMGWYCLDTEERRQSACAAARAPHGVRPGARRGCDGRGRRVRQSAPRIGPAVLRLHGVRLRARRRGAARRRAVLARPRATRGSWAEARRPASGRRQRPTRPAVGLAAR